MVGHTLNVNGDNMGSSDVYHTLTMHHVCINRLEWLTSWSIVLLKKLNFSASHFMETASSLLLYVPILCQINPPHIPPLHPVSLKFISISSSHLSQGLPSYLFPSAQVSLPTPCMHIFFPPYMSHAPPISSFLLF